MKSATANRARSEELVSGRKKERKIDVKREKNVERERGNERRGCSARLRRERTIVHELGL